MVDGCRLKQNEKRCCRCKEPLPELRKCRYCRDCAADYARERGRSNPQLYKDQYARRKAYCRKKNAEHYQKNRESRLAANRKWYKENPLWACASTSKRRAFLKDAPDSFTAQDLERIYEAQGWLCACCQEMKPLTVDHVIPLSRGGSNGPDNLQGLCKSCNSAKKDMTMEEFLEKRAA